MQLDAKTTAFWQAFLTSLPQPDGALARFYEVFHIGDSPESADEGAALIKQGVKTATSSLLWLYHASEKPLPAVGALSIVADGRGDPVCIVETISVEIKGFEDVGADFAHAYGDGIAVWKLGERIAGRSMRRGAEPSGRNLRRTCRSPASDSPNSTRWRNVAQVGWRRCEGHCGDQKVWVAYSSGS